MIPVLREGGFILIVTGVFLLALWAVWPRRGRQKLPRAERGERLATDTDIRAVHGEWPPGILRAEEEPADEQVRAFRAKLEAARGVLPLTPLPAPTGVYRRPAQVPRIAPDVQCRALPDYVTAALGGHRTVDECVDSIVMRAVKAS